MGEAEVEATEVEAAAEAEMEAAAEATTETKAEVEATEADVVAAVGEDKTEMVLKEAETAEAKEHAEGLPTARMAEEVIANADETNFNLDEFEAAAKRKVASTRVTAPEAVGASWSSISVLR